MTALTVSVTMYGVPAEVLPVRRVYTGQSAAGLVCDIRELSAQRKTFTQVHELAHHVMAEGEINRTGMTALSDACALLQQSAQTPAVEWPSSFLGTATAPAVDLVDLPYALPEFGLPPWHTGALSRAFLQPLRHPFHLLSTSC